MERDFFVADMHVPRQGTAHWRKRCWMPQPPGVSRSAISLLRACTYLGKARTLAQAVLDAPASRGVMERDFCIADMHVPRRGTYTGASGVGCPRHRGCHEARFLYCGHAPTSARHVHMYVPRRGTCMSAIQKSRSMTPPEAGASNTACASARRICLRGTYCRQCRNRALWHPQRPGAPNTACASARRIARHACELPTCRQCRNRAP